MAESQVMVRIRLMVRARTGTVLLAAFQVTEFRTNDRRAMVESRMKEPRMTAFRRSMPRAMSEPRTAQPSEQVAG
jgi:hypothetical protein